MESCLHTQGKDILEGIGSPELVWACSAWGQALIRICAGRM